MRSQRLLGVRDEITYEAQAAIELETLARSSPPANHIYPFSIRDEAVHTGDILAAIIGDLESGTPKTKIARAFHDTMAEVAARMALDARAKSGIDVVALSGGCFQNRLCKRRRSSASSEKGSPSWFIAGCRLTTADWPWGRRSSRPLA